MLAKTLAVAFCALVLLVGIDHAEMFRNEGLRASLAAEVLRGDSWLVPHLHGEPHLTKPPGMSVLIALCSFPFAEVTPITSRMPSVLAAALFMGLFGAAVARRFGREAGWLAALLLPCCPLWLDRVPSAEIDLVQLAWVGGAFLCLLRAVEDDSTAWWLAAMACVAGGFFTKWTAPLFFYLTVLPWLATRRDLRLMLARGHLLGLAGLVVVAGLWLTVVGRTAGWDVLWQTLSREALLRFSPAHHPRPYPWTELATFPIGFIVGCLPCSLALLVVFRPSFAGRWDQPQQTFLRLCQFWLLTSLLFWTLAPGHRPRHLLPAQPAVVGMAVMVLVAWQRDLAWPRRQAVLGAFLVFWLLVKGVFVGVAVPQRQAARRPLEGAAVLAASVPAREVLHVAQLKDDGLLFHYGRPVRRLRGEAEVERGAWCLLTAKEWERWNHGQAQLVVQLTDGQGSPLVLVRRNPASGVGESPMPGE